MYDITRFLIVTESSVLVQAIRTSDTSHEDNCREVRGSRSPPMYLDTPIFAVTRGCYDTNVPQHVPSSAELVAPKAPLSERVSPYTNCSYYLRKWSPQCTILATIAPSQAEICRPPAHHTRLTSPAQSKEARESGGKERFSSRSCLPNPLVGRIGNLKLSFST